MVYLVIPLIVSVVALLWFYTYWKLFKRQKCVFNYRITDIWTAMLSLFPTMALAGFVFRNPEQSNDVDGWKFLVCATFGLGLFQITGLAVGRMDLEIRKDRLGEPTAWTSAVSIFAGAAIGMVIAAIIVPLAFAFSMLLR